MATISLGGVTAINEYLPKIETEKIVESRIKKSEAKNKRELTSFYACAESDKLEVQKEIEKLKTEVLKIEEINKLKEINIVEIIGAFVGFFTFISIQINIFRMPLGIWSFMGFSLLNLSSITFFVLVLQTVLRRDSFRVDNINFFKTFNFLLLFVSIVGAFISVCLVYIGQNKEFKYIFINKDDNTYTILDTKMEGVFINKINMQIASSSEKSNKEISDLKSCLYKNNYSKNCLK